MFRTHILTDKISKINTKLCNVTDYKLQCSQCLYCNIQKTNYKCKRYNRESIIDVRKDENKCGILGKKFLNKKSTKTFIFYKGNWFYSHDGIDQKIPIYFRETGKIKIE